LRTMSSEEWNVFVDNLIAELEFDVIGVKAKGSKFVFGRLEDSSELRLDHDVTILPPKKELLPPNEDLMTFDISKPFDVFATHEERKKVLIGVHPYDVHAINMMDAVYLGRHVDDHYEMRRKNTIIIASDILTIGKRSFAASLGTHVVEKGFDLLVTPLGEKVAIQIGTPAGEDLLNRFGKSVDATRNDMRRVEKLREDLPSKYKKRLLIDKYSWSEVLSNNYEHPLWEENARKCLTCGSCTLVCPTCVCYDVSDEVELDLERGKRKRTWDGCLLKEFTMVGSGEIFRETPKNRYRHRYYRKGLYLPMRNGFVACVGCGRCATQCLPDIADPLEVMNVLASYSMDDKRKLPIPEVRYHGVKQELLVPKSATIVSKQQMTDIDTMYKIKLDNGKPLGHRPGQFIELSIFGIGEAPISIASAPGGAEFELQVRKIGDVTTKLDTLPIGSKVGIRGPFGNGFDTTSLKGRNLLYIGGGCGMAPLRSLINYTIDNRQDFKNITILYGCKDPSALLFREDLKAWGEMNDVKMMLTVDRCDNKECWDGNVGVITTLIPKVEFDPTDTIVFVVGPPVMYKYVIRELKQKGVPDENIIVSLERRMKCGVGKCGHCQINGVFVCLEGPVFKYSDIRELPEAF
jgi:sulfite reductase subunit B